MIHPDDISRPFVARWNALVSALLIEPSIKLVARTACDYGIRDGEGIYPGNERLARQTGLSEKTVREAWHFLRATGMAHRDARSAWTGTRRTADVYALGIPDDWRALAVAGPNSGRFSCQQCGRKFNPPACNVFLAETRSGHRVPVTASGTGLREVRWAVWKAVFCPAPAKGPSCRDRWEKKNGPWSAARNEPCWLMFREARNDDWPDLGHLAAA